MVLGFINSKYLCCQFNTNTKDVDIRVEIKINFGELGRIAKSLADGISSY